MTPRDRDDWESAWPRLAATARENPASEYRTRLILAALGSVGSADAISSNRWSPRVIDFGSGQGGLALAMGRALPAAEIVGFELASTAVELARRRVPRARFYQRNLFDEDDEETARLRGWADVATCSELLEHLDDPGGALRAIGRYLRPGAALIITVPSGPMSEFDRAIGHRRHYRPEQLRALVEGAGYRVETARAAGFPFFNVYKLAVVLRGEKVLRDAERDDVGAAMGAAYAAFRALFRLNASSTPWGWQLLLAARR